MQKNIIISVESRKGGVGKTTAALCIGKSLLEKGYAILLIDTDITGTNIADCIDSPFWHDSLNILAFGEDKKELRANLLDFFEEDFMNGNKLPSFQSNPNIRSGNAFNADITKINVIGSQIYSLDGKPATICKPAILFDQLHSYWFVDFLKELIEDFAASTNDRPVAVVLDNSPGYVGIAPAIQDWLTDLGPKTGKFLMVTSLDSQDMQSCANAILNLHEQYKEKWNTSRMFLQAMEDTGSDLDYSLMKGDFFIKLAEQDESCNSRFPAPFEFYKISKVSAGSKPKTNNNVDDEGSEYLEFPEKYMGVIVNRVPKSVFKQRRTYRPDLQNDTPFLNLLGGHESREWSKFMVGYDPYIEYQFLQSGMSKRRYRRKWSRNLDRLLMQKESIFYEKEFLHMIDIISPASFSRMNDYVNQFQNIVDTAIDAMRANGLDYLADLIDEDWQPKSIVSNLQATFYNFMANSDHPFFKEIYWEEFEDERMMKKKGLHRLEKIMHRLDIPSEKMETYPEISNTVFYLIASLPLPIGRMPFDEELMEFFRAMIKFELRLIEETKNKHRNLPRILSTDIKYKIDIKEMLHKFEFGGRLFHRAEGEFFDFFHSFTSAQARLMTLPEDTRFLIWLIKTMVEFESEKPNAIPYVRKIAEDVILHKTLPYDAVKEKSSVALSEAQYFVDFDKTIKNIVNRWGLGL